MESSSKRLRNCLPTPSPINSTIPRSLSGSTLLSGNCGSPPPPTSSPRRSGSCNTSSRPTIFPTGIFVIRKTGRGTTSICFGRLAKLAVKICRFRSWALGAFAPHGALPWRTVPPHCLVNQALSLRQRQRQWTSPKTLVLQQDSAIKAGRRRRFAQHPHQVVADLTNSEPSRFNRFSNHAAHSDALTQVHNQVRSL